MADIEERDTARNFTNAKRITILFGKWPNGGRIPGGPYTGVQLVFGGVFLLVGWWTRPIWGPATGWPALIQIAGLILFTLGATILCGRIPATRRKLPDLVMDGFTAAAAPTFGKYQGRQLRLHPPRTYTGTVLMDLGMLPEVAAAEAVAADAVATETTPTAPAPGAVVIPEPAPNTSNVIPFPSRTPATSGVQHLLELARQKDAAS